jgi:hypothetical protein
VGVVCFALWEIPTSEYTLNKETNAIVRGKRNSGKPSLQGKNMEGILSGIHEEAASTPVYPPPA